MSTKTKIDVASAIDAMQSAVKGSGAVKTPTLGAAAAHESTAVRDIVAKSQRGVMLVKLPVSKVSVQAKERVLDPRRCKVSPLNRRQQSLLTARNPAVRELMTSMRDFGQQMPVLVRTIEDEQFTHEVIYGSRRRFCAELLTEERGELFGLDAYVLPNLGDPDAEALAKLENESEQISDWEWGQAILGLLNGGLTGAIIAKQESISEGRVSELKRVAELPMEIMQLFQSPNVVSSKQGAKLARLLGKNGSLSKKLIADVEPGSLDEVKMLIDLAPTKPVVAVNKPVVIKDKKGGKKGRIAKHRTIEGQYKVDLYNVSSDTIEALADWLQSR